MKCVVSDVNHAIVLGCSFAETLSVNSFEEVFKATEDNLKAFSLGTPSCILQVIKDLAIYHNWFCYAPNAMYVYI